MADGRWVRVRTAYSGIQILSRPKLPNLPTLTPVPPPSPIPPPPQANVSAVVFPCGAQSYKSQLPLHRLFSPLCQYSRANLDHSNLHTRLYRVRFFIIILSAIATDHITCWLISTCRKSSSTLLSPTSRDISPTAISQFQPALNPLALCLLRTESRTQESHDHHHTIFTLFINVLTRFIYLRSRP